ncbi:MAG: amidase [Pseudomonadota bacterium]
MKRRQFVGLGMAAAALPAAQAAGRNLEGDVAALQARMAAGTLSAHALVVHYLARIKAIDKAGPRINAIIELNPDALAIATKLDDERKAGKLRGPLHGIPVLVKDNIATGDKMCTTAGSLALDGVRARRDAPLVEKLRAAGAIILGKTNLSEWANMRSSRSTSGWSARGGLTVNPYALDRSCGGSSSGSAAAVAAELAVLAVGTETDGSIVSPASLCGVVGIKPTVGLVSGSGIIPIAHSQDTAGPMARCVADAALLLGALAEPAQDYSAALRKDGLQGMRLGVAREYFGRNEERDALIERALKVLAAQGAILVDVAIPNRRKYDESELAVLLYEFKPGLAAYLAEYAPHALVKTMADVITFNEAHAGREMPHFQQRHLLASNAKGGLEEQAYLDAVANNRRYARTEGIDQVMKEQQLDALVCGTTGPAWLIDFINGDQSVGGFASPAAVAGYPHITVPAGYMHGLPIGLSFVGGANSEAALIRMAFAFEQATLHRRAPQFAKTATIKE